MTEGTEKETTLDGWSADLSVGVDIIDEDHQAFFRLAGLLRDVIEGPEEGSDYLVETAINILEEYVEGHFLREEMAMVAVNYPFLAEHLAAHQAFAAKAHQIAQEYRSGNKDIAGTISDLVERWIVGHIQTIDKQYCGYLTNDNVDGRPLIYLSDEDGDELEV
jgi:hemerythrin